MSIWCYSVAISLLPPKHFPVVLKFLAPDTLPATAVNRSPAPAGRHAAAFPHNAARFPALAPADLRLPSPNKSPPLHPQQFPGECRRDFRLPAAMPPPHALAA